MLDDEVAGCYWNVVIAFWRQVASDLAAGNSATWFWLSTSDFADWAAFVDLDADELRDRLRETYHPGHAHPYSRRAAIIRR